MRNLYHVITIRGMPVRLHYTWIVLALLGVWVIGGVIVPAYFPTSSLVVRGILALVILALCFGTVVVHELAHLLVARLFDVHFPVLNLYPLGAVTRRSDRRGRPKAEFWIAAAGPATSLALWGMLAGISSVEELGLWLPVALYIAGQFSLILGLINLLPGLPLDGGRMVRAAIWGLSSFESATKLAWRLGQVIAYGFIFVGAWRIVTSADWLWGGAAILVGWAMREAGGTAYRRALVDRLLTRLTVADVSQTPTRVVAPSDTLNSFGTSLRGSTGRLPTPVVADDMFVGMIDRDRALDVPQGNWELRTVGETMISAAELTTLTPKMPLSLCIPYFVQKPERRWPIPVLQEGRLVGLVDTHQVSEILDLEEEFGLVAHQPHAQPPVGIHAASATTLLTRSR